jgi:hypothetical protein
VNQVEIRAVTESMQGRFINNLLAHNGGHQQDGQIGLAQEDEEMEAEEELLLERSD